MIGDSVFALIQLVLAAATMSSDTSFSFPNWAVLPWAGVVAISFIWLRTRPEITGWVLVASHILQLVVCRQPLPQNLLVPIVLYQLSLRTSGRRRILWLVISMLSSVAAGLSWGTPSSHVFAPQDRLRVVVQMIVLMLFCAAACLAAWFAGSTTRNRRLTMDALRQRAIDLERDRDQSIRLATQEERTKIARDMHDIVAHSLSVIVVQADGGSYLAHHEETGDLQTRLDASAKALDTIADTARHALDETRHLVGVLRSDDEAAERAPAMGLSDVPALVKEMRGALDVSLRITGDPQSHPPLPQGADLACYRVIQEALTNVLKHAGPTATAQVLVEHHPDRVEVLVADNGTGSGVDGIHRSDGRGHGLVGMHERVSAWGGMLEAGDRSELTGDPTDHGFRVHAVIPAR